MEIKQGAIYLADLNPVKGHEQGGYRPVVVLQNNILNGNLNTVIVAPLTKNLKAKGFFTTFFIPKAGSKLDFDSIALLFQVRTIDKARLKTKVCELDSQIFAGMMEQLSLVF